MAMVAVGAVTGCGGASSSPSPESSSGSPASSLTATPSVDEKAQVAAGYRAYLDASARLFAGDDPDPKIEANVATPEAAQHDAEAAATLFSTGYRMAGTETFTVRSVTVTGSSAVLLVCLDSTRNVSVKRGTAPSPGQTGLPPRQGRVQMVRGDTGNWLFKDSQGAGPC